MKPVNNCIGPCLIEKAWAKKNDGYLTFRSNPNKKRRFRFCEIINWLTGFLVERIPVYNHNFSGNKNRYTE